MTAGAAWDLGGRLGARHFDHPALGADSNKSAGADLKVSDTLVVAPFSVGAVHQLPTIFFGTLAVAGRLAPLCRCCLARRPSASWKPLPSRFPDWPDSFGERVASGIVCSPAI
jgi:hypothetical protein